MKRRLLYQAPNNLPTKIPRSIAVTRQFNKCSGCGLHSLYGLADCEICDYPVCNRCRDMCRVIISKGYYHRNRVCDRIICKSCTVKRCWKCDKTTCDECMVITRSTCCWYCDNRGTKLNPITKKDFNLDKLKEQTKKSSERLYDCIIYTQV